MQYNTYILRRFYRRDNCCTWHPWSGFLTIVPHRSIATKAEVASLLIIILSSLLLLSCYSTQFKLFLQRPLSISPFEQETKVLTYYKATTHTTYYCSMPRLPKALLRLHDILLICWLHSTYLDLVPSSCRLC